MVACYKKLWKLLIDKDMTKTGLRMASGVSSSTIAKMMRGDDIKVSILVRHCEVLGCDIGDIIQILPSTERKIADCKRKNCVYKPSKKQNTSRRTAATSATNSNVGRAIA